MAAHRRLDRRRVYLCADESRKGASTLCGAWPVIEQRISARREALRRFARSFFLHHSLSLILHYSVVWLHLAQFSTLCSMPKRVPQLAATRKLVSCERPQ